MVPKGDSSDNFIGGDVYSSQSYGSRIGTINKGHDIGPKPISNEGRDTRHLTHY